MIWIIVGVAVLAAAGGGYVIYQRRRPSEDAPRLHCRCPNCERKLHYHAERAGRQARCPVCKKPFTYPPLPPSAE